MNDSPIEQLRRALRDVLPNATDEQISAVADKVCQVAHPLPLNYERLQADRASL